MKTWLSWALLLAALLLGVGGGVLAAEVNALLFWPGYLGGLVIIAIFIWKTDKLPAAPEEKQESKELPPSPEGEAKA